MNKSNKSKRTAPNQLDTTVAGKATEAPQKSPNQEPAPPAWVRSIMSFLVLVHLFALAVSFLSVVEPSETQLAVLQTLSPYLRFTHFGAEERPVYLAHAEPIEQPHRLQILRSGSEDQWETIEPTGRAGLAQSDRYGRWVRTMVRFAENEQPGLLASLLLPQLELLAANDPSHPILQVRIIRLPTELTTVADDAQPPPYVAAVAASENRINLVRIKDERQSAQTRFIPESRTSDEGAKGQ